MDFLVQHAEVTTETVAAPAEAPPEEKEPQRIAVAEIASEAEQTRLWIREIESSLQPSVIVQRIEELLPETAEQIEAMNAALEPESLELASSPDCADLRPPAGGTSRAGGPARGRHRHRRGWRPPAQRKLAPPPARPGYPRGLLPGGLARALPRDGRCTPAPRESSWCRFPPGRRRRPSPPAPRSTTPADWSRSPPRYRRARTRAPSVPAP